VVTIPNRSTSRGVNQFAWTWIMEPMSIKIHSALGLAKYSTETCFDASVIMTLMFKLYKNTVILTPFSQ